MLLSEIHPYVPTQAKEESGVFRTITVTETSGNMIKTIAGENGDRRHSSILFRNIQAFHELSSRSYSYRRAKLSFFRKFRYLRSLWPQKSYHGLLFVLLHSICRMINVSLYYYYPNNEVQMRKNS
jgi:hypothetical protein